MATKAPKVSEAAVVTEETEVTKATVTCQLSCGFEVTEGSGAAGVNKPTVGGQLFRGLLAAEASKVSEAAVVTKATDGGS